MLARPEIEGGSGDFIDNRHGESESREIDVLDIVPAAVARIDTEISVRRCLEVCELPLVVLAAACAQQTRERPRRQACGTDQRATAAVRQGLARDLQYRQLRCPQRRTDNGSRPASPVAPPARCPRSRASARRVAESLSQRTGRHTRRPNRSAALVDSWPRTFQQIAGLSSEPVRTGTWRRF